MPIMQDFGPVQGPYKFVLVRTTGPTTNLDILGGATAAGFQYLVRAARVWASANGTFYLHDDSAPQKVIIDTSDVGPYEANFGPFDNKRTQAAGKLQVDTTGAGNTTIQVWYSVVETNKL